MEFLAFVLVFGGGFLMAVFIICAKDSYTQNHPSKEKKFMDSVYDDKSLTSEERATKVAEHLNDRLQKDLHMI